MSHNRAHKLSAYERPAPAPVAPILSAFGQPVSQAEYDALVAKFDRLLRLCQTHGLMIE